MVKDTMATIPITPGTPGYVEDFRYQDGGMERNVQDEFDTRGDHITVSRVVNWEIANEAEFGLTGWTPGNSLLLTVNSNNLFVTEGMAYVGGRRVLEGGSELFSSDDPATDTYYVYLQYTFGDTEAYGYSASLPTDSDTVKHVILGTADWNTGTKFWTNPVDLRASNTSLVAPATVSGSDAGFILTVENTGAGGGLLSKDASQIGEDGAPTTLIIWGTTTTGLTLYEDTGNNSVILSCDGTTSLKIGGDLTVANITPSGAVGGVTLSGGDATADALNLRDATDQIVLDSDGTFTGTISMDTLTSTNKTWTFPDATGTIGVTGDGGAMSIETSGAVTHATTTGYKHVPASGGSTQILQWDSDGTAKWVTLSSGISIADGGAVTVDGTAHSHVSAQISALDVADTTTGTFAVARGGTGQSAYTIGDILYANTTSTLAKLGVGAANAVLMGGTNPTWDATPSVSTITTTGSGSNIAGSATVGGVVMNSGAISSVTTISCSSYADVDYLQLSDDAVATSNKITLGNNNSLGTTFEIMAEGGAYLQVTPSTGARCYFGQNGTGFGFSADVYASGFVCANGTDIIPEGTNNSQCGTDTANKYWSDVYSDNLWYKTGGLGTFDHLDDLAIIDSIVPTKEKNKEGIPIADLSGVPKEIAVKDDWMRTGGMEMLLVGGVKQLHKKVKDQEELIAALMDQIEEIKKELKEKENAS